MGIFKKKKNKSFNYTPRFYKGEGNPYKIKQMFDDHRTTIGTFGVKGKFLNAWDDFRTNKDRNANRRVLVIALVLLLLFLIWIDIDFNLIYR